MKPAIAVLLAALSAGCSSIFPGGNAQQPLPLIDPVPPPKGLPADYKQFIRGSVTLAPATLLNGALVSPMQPVSGPQVGQWVVCIKTAGDSPSYFTVLADNQTIVTVRRAVAVDRCETQAYTPLHVAPPPAAAKQPAKKRK